MKIRSAGMREPVQVHEHTSTLGTWRTLQRSADPCLRAYIHGFVGSSSYLPSPVLERHLPSTEVSLVVNFASPHRQLVSGEQDGWISRDGAWVAGLHDRYRITQAAGERRFMVVRFTPLGAHFFLRTPMHLIASQSVDLAAIDPRLSVLLMTRLHAVENWSDRFDIAEHIIAERVLHAAKPDVAAWAWSSLSGARNGIAVSSIAAEAGCSQRHLIKQFRNRVGLAPKKVARLFRFNLAVRALNAFGRSREHDSGSTPYLESMSGNASWGGALPWADIAARCGYFDQPHFIREFRDFAGLTPTAFVQRTTDTV